MATNYLLIDAATDLPYWEAAPSDYALTILRSTDDISWEFPLPSSSTHSALRMDDATDVPEWNP